MTIPAAEGGCVIGPECMALTLFYLCLSYGMIALSPKLAGKFQTSSTVIKMIPLALMAVVGTIVGIGNGRMAENFSAMTAIAFISSPFSNTLRYSANGIM